MSDLSHRPTGDKVLATVARNLLITITERDRQIAERDETIRQLNKEIDDLIKTDNETIRSLFAYQAKRDATIRQLRAQLDEYERAPTVATVGHHYADTYRIFGTPPPVGTELIARPTRKGE